MAKRIDLVFEIIKNNPNKPLSFLFKKYISKNDFIMISNFSSIVTRLCKTKRVIRFKNEGSASFYHIYCKNNN